MVGLQKSFTDDGYKKTAGPDENGGFVFCAVTVTASLHRRLHLLRLLQMRDESRARVNQHVLQFGIFRVRYQW